MTIWEDISLHIHKIVSCVLTIPFVELCPNILHCNHLCTFCSTSSNMGLYLSFIYHSPNKLRKKDMG